MGLDAYVASTLAFSLHVSRIIGWVTTFFSTSHVIPHDRAMVLVPGVVYLHALQKVISVWYPTEITFCRPTLVFQIKVLHAY